MTTAVVGAGTTADDAEAMTMEADVPATTVVDVAVAVAMTMEAGAPATTVVDVVVAEVTTVVEAVVETIPAGAMIAAATDRTMAAAVEAAEVTTMPDHERRTADGAGVARMMPWPGAIPKAKPETGHGIRRRPARGEPTTSSTRAESALRARMTMAEGWTATGVSSLEMIAA